MLQLARRHDPRVNRHAALFCHSDDTVIEPRRHNEFRAIVERRVRLFRTEHGTGTREHLGNLVGHSLKALERPVRTEYDFRDLQATGCQRT